MRSWSRHVHWLILSSVLWAGAGCGRYLVATPNLLLEQDPRHVFAGTAHDGQTAGAQVLYATDRAPGDRNSSRLTYGYGRSTSLAFGAAEVALHPHPSWSELVQATTTSKRSREYELKLAQVQEFGRIKRALDPAWEPDATIVQASVREAVSQRDQFCALLQSRLAQTAQKDVFIFIHGYNNTFDDSVFRAAEVWHFMGRIGVPIAYSWPAGLGGVRGYAYDRESGEFTVSHLREFIRSVASCPAVERVHLIAHSRGTDVTMSALRELSLQARAQGKQTLNELKLENLVLAAPDVDEDVFIQRGVGEKILQAAKRTTIYVSGHDRVIGAADLLFASRQRLGTLAIKDIQPKVREKLAKMPCVQLIECKVSGWRLTHSYVFEHPAALSDLILVLRDRRPPGVEHGRPLHQPAEGVWILTDDYLARTR